MAPNKKKQQAKEKIQSLLLEYTKVKSDENRIIALRRSLHLDILEALTSDEIVGETKFIQSVILEL